MLNFKCLSFSLIAFLCFGLLIIQFGSATAKADNNGNGNSNVASVSTTTVVTNENNTLNEYSNTELLMVETPIQVCEKPGWFDSFGVCSTQCSQNSVDWFRNFFNDIICDYSIYFGKENLYRLGGVFAVTGLMANTNIDRGAHRSWQRDIRHHNHRTDGFLNGASAIGKFSYFRVYIAAVIVGGIFKDDYLSTNLLYQWGYRALRTMILISPQEKFFSWALGSGRASDGQQSKWRFFGKGGNASCSGHAFNGAIPFLTAAMMTDYLPVRYGLYAVSTLPGLSRVNKGKHYLSQFVLGWSLAYLSSKAIDDADNARGNYVNFIVVPEKEGLRMQASYQF